MTSNAPTLPRIKGFDRNGEPELRQGENGALEIVFNFMPPQTAAGEDRAPELFDDFEIALAKHLGVDVRRDDREVFIISTPKADTAAQAADYLSTFWKEHAKPLRAVIAAQPQPPNAPFATLNAFHAAIVEHLAEPLKAYKFKKAGKSRYRDSHAVYFKRASAVGSEVIMIHGGHLAPYLNPAASLYATHDIVELIVGPNSGHTEENWLHFQTVSKLLIPAEVRTVTRAYLPSELKAWCEQLLTELEATGLSTLSNLSDPAFAERMLNDMSVDPPDYLKAYSDWGPVRGLALAKLVERADIKDIAAFHHRHLATLEFKPPYMDLEPVVLSTPRDELVAQAKARAKR